MDRFDAKLIVLQRRQDEHLVRVGSLLARSRSLDVRRARRQHDGLLDPLARALLDALNERGEGQSYPAQLLTRMVEATCLPIDTNSTQIRQAVHAAWEVAIALDDVDYIHAFTKGGTDAGKFQLVGHALETIKAWILVTEAALDRAPVVPVGYADLAATAQRHLTGRRQQRPITGPHRGKDPA